MRAQTQDDMVKQDQGYEQKEVVVQVAIPGIDQLHTKSTDEIAEVLAVVLKSEKNIVRLDWNVEDGKMAMTIRR